MFILDFLLDPPDFPGDPFTIIYKLESENNKMKSNITELKNEVRELKFIRNLVKINIFFVYFYILYQVMKN